MTNLQEAKLAREAEICFGTIALSTDYDCWRESGEEVSVEAVLEVMSKNVKNSKAILRNVVQEFTISDSPCRDQSALQFAVLTNKGSISNKEKERLHLLLRKYL